MQINLSPRQLNPFGHLSRLFRWYELRILRSHLTDLSEQLAQLQAGMALDRVVIAAHRNQWLLTPTLDARLLADRRLEVQLTTDIENVSRAIAELEAQQ